MKKFLILVILMIIFITSSCQADDTTNIYIGDDGYWYIDNQKTGTYSIGDNGKNAYELACENGYEGTLDEWLALLQNKDGKLILVTAISPTPLGEGKTTISISIADGLRKIGKK